VSAVALNPAPIALTIGEPAGIGPELAVAAWRRLGARLPFFVVGDPGHLDHLGVPVRTIAAPAEAAHVALTACRSCPIPSRPRPSPAEPDPKPMREAVIAAIARAVDLVMRGEASALTTGPIHKKALIDGAGFAYPGHTEYLAHLAGVDRVVMMLAGPDLRVVPTTIHIALKEVPGALTPRSCPTRSASPTRRCAAISASRSPRIAVAGLNPHAGEGGVMGREEIEIIAPVIEALRAEGLGLTGPHSADTMFHAAARARYDAAIAMYHDQALIPIKTLAFDEG
jgi:4-hydroxythreonine-4-phosphate dehydrogenase